MPAEDMSERSAADLADSRGVRVRVWDIPTRIFHWLLVVLVAVSLYTGLSGGFREMEWHVRSGLAILALMVFRIVWGFIGSRRSRFADFVRGPAAVFAYARDIVRGRHVAAVGHNPLGGWSVIAMLISLCVQAGTGLFSNDDILTEGPLAKLVTEAASDWLTVVHNINAVVLMVLVAIHVSAIAFYALVLRENLVRSMITGRKRPAGAAKDAPFAPLWLAAVAAGLGIAAVWAILAL